MTGFLALDIAAITAREQPEASDDGKSFWCEAPSGWKKRVTYRAAPTVNNKCKADVYFYAPTDSIQTTRFRSEKKLREYLLKNTGLIPDLPPPEAFDWSYPGGTREGKCKSGPPLSFKAAPDTPRHAPVKTTGKRDPRKRPRESPTAGQQVAAEQPLLSEGGLANRASERVNGSGNAQPLDEYSEGQEAKPGEKEIGESSGDRSRSEAGPLAKKKRKGKPDTGAKLVEEKDVQGGQSTPADQSTSGSTGTKGESGVGANTEIKDKVEASAEQILSGTGDKQLVPPAPPKRKGRPPRVKKDGAGAEKAESAGGGKSGDVRGEENGAQLPSEEVVHGSHPPAAAADLAHEATVRAGAASNGVADPDQARLGAHEGAEPRHSDQQKGGGLSGGASPGQVPRSGPVVGPGRGKKPGNLGVSKKNANGVDGEGSRGRSEGSRVLVSAGGTNAEDQENQGECRKRAPVEKARAESSPPLSEMAGKQINHSVEADAKTVGMHKVCDPSLKEQVPGRMDIKVEKEKVGECSRGPVLEKAEVKVESRCADVGDRQAQEPADETGTPLSILDAERDRAMNGGSDTGPNPTPTGDRSPARKEDGEESVKAPAIESPELQCSESVPSPEKAASEDPVDTAPSESQPELEPSVTKAMRKKARLAKVLGPHEVLERPRRERSGPPPMSVPQGIADAVKLRTAGMQAQKKDRQQAGERFYSNRMPQGLSVSAVIAAAAAAPPSPVPRIRGRPPKQKNGVGTSRLGGGKQSGEEAEERRAQEQREEHVAAVKIFQDEEAERERVLKERGSFHPRDETLGDRPKVPPVKGKRRTKSAIIAEHWERLAQAKLELGEDEWLLPEDGDDNETGERQFDGGARGTLLNSKQMEVRVWMEKGRSAAAGEDFERGNALGETDTWGEKSQVRKKRKGGWTAVRTQKRTALANRGGDAGPSRRRPSQHPRAHCPYMPSDPEPDPTYDSDANSSELKMGQKLDEHGFFERDDFEVASQEPRCRKPPRERLPIEAPPQRRRSFGHRKGPSGIQAREGVRKPAEAECAADVADGLAAIVGSGFGQAADELEQGAGENGHTNKRGGASVGGLEAKCEVQEEPEKETKMLRWEGAWGPAAGAGPLLDNGRNVSVGRRSAEPLTMREHLTVAPTLTSV